jgi:hypothetical protein
MVSMWQRKKADLKYLKGGFVLGVRVDIILSPGEPLPKGSAPKVADIARQAIAKMAGIKANNLEIIKVTHRTGDAPISKHISW